MDAYIACTMQLSAELSRKVIDSTNEATSFVSLVSQDNIVNLLRQENQPYSVIDLVDCLPIPTGMALQSIFRRAIKPGRKIILRGNEGTHAFFKIALTAVRECVQAVETYIVDQLGSHASFFLISCLALFFTTLKGLFPKLTQRNLTVCIQRR